MTGYYKPGMTGREKWMLRAALLIGFLSLLTVAFAVVGTDCSLSSIRADSSCSVGDDDTILNDLAIRSDTAFDLTLSHNITADRAVTFPDAAGVVVLDANAQAVSAKTITASAIDSSIIGGSTPAAGTFTTVYATGTSAAVFIDKDTGTAPVFALISDITHGCVTNCGLNTPTDTYFQMAERYTDGGLHLSVVADDAAVDNPYRTWISGGTATTVKDATTSTVGLQNTVFMAHNGADVRADVTADANLVTYQPYFAGAFTTVWGLDEDGDTLQTGAVGFLVSADPGGITNAAHVYAKDVSTSAEIFVRDEAGNATQISPHDPLTNRWIFNSCNDFSGRCVEIDMEAALIALGSLTGQTLITETFIPVEDRLDWDSVERDKQSKAQASIAAWDARVAAGVDVDALGARPEPYTPRAKPAWLAP